MQAAVWATLTCSAPVQSDLLIRIGSSVVGPIFCLRACTVFNFGFEFRALFRVGGFGFGVQGWFRLRIIWLLVFKFLLCLGCSVVRGC